MDFNLVLEMEGNTFKKESLSAVKSILRKVYKKTDIDIGRIVTFLYDARRVILDLAPVKKNGDKMQYTNIVRSSEEDPSIIIRYTPLIIITKSPEEIMEYAMEIASSPDSTKSYILNQLHNLTLPESKDLLNSKLGKKTIKAAYARYLENKEYSEGTVSHFK